MKPSLRIRLIKVYEHLNCVKKAIFTHKMCYMYLHAPTFLRLEVQISNSVVVRDRSISIENGVFSPQILTDLTSSSHHKKPNENKKYSAAKFLKLPRS